MGVVRPYLRYAQIVDGDGGGPTLAACHYRLLITALHTSMRFPFATETNKKRKLTICGFITR
jgi:hypothetical protein